MRYLITLESYSTGNAAAVLPETEQRATGDMTMLCISQHQTNMSCTQHSSYCTETTNLVHFKRSFLDCTKHILYCTHHYCFSYNKMYINLNISSLSPRLPVKSMREGGMVMIWPVSLLPVVLLVLRDSIPTHLIYIHLNRWQVAENVFILMAFKIRSQVAFHKGEIK